MEGPYIIPETSRQTFLEILDFLYSGNVQLSIDNVQVKLKRSTLNPLLSLTVLLLLVPLQDGRHVTYSGDEGCMQTICVSLCSSASCASNVRSLVSNLSCLLNSFCHWIAVQVYALSSGSTRKRTGSLQAHQFPRSQSRRFEQSEPKQQAC